MASIAVASLLLAGLAACDRRRRPPDFYLGGIQVNEPDQDHWAETLRGHGMNTVEVTVYAKQGDWDTDHLWFEEADWVIEEIEAARRAGLAVALILRVALDHAYERNRFLWHGMIMPRSDAQLASWFDSYGEFVLHWAEVAERHQVELLGISSELNALTSTRPLEALPPLEAYYLDAAKQDERRRRILGFETEIESEHLNAGWQANYDSLPRFLDDESVAQQRWALQTTGWRAEEDPALLLQRLNERRSRLESHWVELIGDVRARFSGELTYAANFDQYEQVGFWPQLDVMGVNAYFELRQAPLDVFDETALGTELEVAWAAIVERLLAYQEEIGSVGQRVLFTELGYTRHLNSTLKPWAADGFSLVGDWEDPTLMVWRRRPIEPRERALSLAALRRALEARSPRLLRGILYWKLSSFTEHEAIEPYVLVLGKKPPDPLEAELRAFLSDS